MTRIPFRSNRRPRILFALAAILACTSCARTDRPPLFSVQGEVYYQGKPAEGASVFFHPVDKATSLAGEGMPHGVVGADGTFHLGTFAAEDGAPAGDYAVTVIWESQPSSRDEDAFNLLPRRYASPATSGLRARVVEGDTQLEPFKLTQGDTRPRR
jgi:hypothetical protein